MNKLFMTPHIAQEVLLQGIEEAIAEFAKTDESYANIRGAGVALVIDPRSDDNSINPGPGIRVIKAFHRGPKPDSGPEDKGANYLSVAFSKLCRMLRTGHDSGMAGDEVFKGEYDYDGGVVRKCDDVWVLMAFSGAKATQDRLICEYAIAALKSDLKERPWDPEMFISQNNK